MNSGVLMELMQFQQKCSLQEKKEGPTKVEKLPTLVQATNHKPSVHKSSSVYHRHPEWDPPKFVFKARPVPRHCFTWKHRSPKKKTLHVMEVKPFSFHERDKDIEKKKSQRLQKIFEEEQKMREYHARPVPSWVFRYCLSSPEMRTLQSHRKKLRNQRDTKTATRERANKLFEEKILQKKALSAKLTEKSPDDNNKQDRKVMLIRSKAEHNISPIKPEKGDQKQSTIVSTTPATSNLGVPGTNKGTLKLKPSAIKPVQKRVDVNKPKVNNTQQNFELKKKPTKVKVFDQKKIQTCGPKPSKIDPVKSKSVKPVNKVQQIVKAKEEIREKDPPEKYDTLEDLMKPARERSVSAEDVVVLRADIPAVPTNSLENLKTVVLDDDHKIEVKAEVKRIDYNHLYESIVEMQQKLTTRRNADDSVKPRAKTILKPVPNFNSKSSESEAKVVPLKRKGSLLSDSNDSV